LTKYAVVSQLGLWRSTAHQDMMIQTSKLYPEVITNPWQDRQLVHSSPPANMLLVIISLAKHKSLQPSVLQRLSGLPTGSTMWPGSPSPGQQTCKHPGHQAGEVAGGQVAARPWGRGNLGQQLATQHLGL